jgi:hypothetical protein
VAPAGRDLLISGAEPKGRAGLADVLGVAYADGLRELFLACGAAGIVGALLVLWLVRAAPPGGERVARPAEAAAAR